jgi:hypothetical protein
MPLRDLCVVWRDRWIRTHQKIGTTRRQADKLMLQGAAAAIKECLHELVLVEHGSIYAVEYFVEVELGGSAGINLTCDGMIPFVPSAGMMLVAIEGDDFRKVEEVYWKPGEPLRVFFKFEKCRRSRWMKKLGWTDADKPERKR